MNPTRHTAVSRHQRLKQNVPTVTHAAQLITINPPMINEKYNKQ